MAVLFSGGLDSCLIAKLLDLVLPKSASIDLVNLVFAADAPDRKTALEAIKELRGLSPRRYNLILMNKRFNNMRGGYSQALAKLRRHQLFVYGTFVFGYDHDTARSFDQAVDFASDEGMYIAAFNHLTPFPGTPLYHRLQIEGRLRYDAWWLDPAYRYNDLPFKPQGLQPHEVTEGCVGARRRFYAWRNIVRRSQHHWRDAFVLRNYFLVNAMHRNEISLRNGYPLGDESWAGPLLQVA